MGDYDVAVGGHAAIYKSSLNPAYVSYYAKSPVFYNAKKQYVHGFKVMEIKPADIAQIDIPVPSLDEQQRIVERLDAAFENIDKLKANAETQLAEARTLFQKSLAKAMKPKEGWEEKTMSEITEVKDGTHDSPKYVTEGIPFVTQKNITINGFDLINTKKITLEDHKKFYTRSNVEFGDIIIAMIGANRGMSCIVNTREIFSIKNVGLIKKTDNINMRFLLYYLHSPAANSYVLENSNGGAQEFIGLKGLRNFPIQFPSLAEQQRIVERLDALSENIRKYEEIQRQIISECDALKQALLRKVFE
jgi:type I restriction enzyme S subunit